MISDAKKNYYQLKFRDNAGNSKTTWKIIKEITNGESKGNLNIEYFN